MLVPRRSTLYWRDVQAFLLSFQFSCASRPLLGGSNCSNAGHCTFAFVFSDSFYTISQLRIVEWVDSVSEGLCPVFCPKSNPGIQEGTIYTSQLLFMSYKENAMFLLYRVYCNQIAQQQFWTLDQRTTDKNQHQNITVVLPLASKSSFFIFFGRLIKM